MCIDGYSPLAGRAMLSVGMLAVAFVVSALLTRRFCDPASRLHLLDHPNERSLHTRPTPRTGGVAILAGLLSAALFGWIGPGGPTLDFGLVVGVALLAVLSFLDDRYGLPVGVRLPGHLAASALLVFGGLSLPALSLPGWEWPWPTWIGTSFSLLFLIWMVNLYNFMDGMDGFAAGMAVIGYGTFALLGYLAGNQSFILLSLVVAAAAGGFLLFNFPPARIFMGDTGSSVLGLLAGGLSIWGVRDGVFPFWVALLVFSPFIVDATATLLRRLRRGERVWEAHKTHYYQRLVQSGWGHRKTVLSEYALMLACGFSALLAQRLEAGGQGAVILFWCLAYPALMFAVHRLEKNKTRS
jgi:UDP-N-acetylmuramyl pentapeptide phosphotransferase/UDP-N-acetylglucosamine-1-phosphate transferase